LSNFRRNDRPPTHFSPTIITATDNSKVVPSGERKLLDNNFKKDLATLDEEIEELQNDLERAVAKFESTKRLE
jgi:hypothetical protein